LEKEGHKIISQSFGNWKKMTKNILSRLDYYIICQISRSIRVEKIGGFYLRVHFNGKSTFGKLDYGAFRDNFEESNEIFWG
jgi:hypothetical protein